MAARSSSTRRRYRSRPYVRRMRLSTRVEPDCSGRCACSQTASHSAMAAMTGARKSFGCGLVKRMRSMPSMASTARSSSPNSVRTSGRRSRPHELTFWPSSVISRTPSSASRVDLGEDLARPPADLAAAHGGHDAVGADGVAAHGDLHPRLEPALALGGERCGEAALVCRAERRTRDAEPTGAEPVAEVMNRARAERDVDERVALEDPIALRLGVAAADRDHRVRVAGLLCLRVAEVCGEPLVGLLADRAGVEDEHVGFGGRRRLAEPELLQQAADALGVVRVHLAPERRDVVAAHRRKCTAGRPVHFWHASRNPSERDFSVRSKREEARGGPSDS